MYRQSDTLPAGFEPATYRLTAGHSNQLSYRRSTSTSVLGRLLSGLGFEPRRLATEGLKSSPLDQLGHPDTYFSPTGFEPVT